MPDPILFVKAMIAAASAGAVCMLAAGWDRKVPSATRVNVAALLAVALALALGCDVFKILPHWPAGNVLDRFLLFVLPAALVIELLAAAPRIPRWPVWGLRLLWALAAGRILLHGSSYLEGAATGWSTRQIYEALTIGVVVLAVVWVLLVRLSQRTPGVSLPLALAETILGAGLLVLLSAYPSGGETGLALAAALAGTVAAACLLVAAPALEGAIGLGVVGLFGILMMGRFFGELTTPRALIVFLTPLLCWVSELPVLCRRPAWQVALVRLALVAVPLACVLFLAQRDFARAMGS